MKLLQTLAEIGRLLLLTRAYNAFAEESSLGLDAVAFAGVETAKTVLTNRDAFINTLSPFDRAARMKTARAVSEREFLEFLSRNVLSWSPEETNRVAAVLQRVREKLTPWRVPLPATVWLIKTSGKEEGKAAYTRQNAIIFPEHEVLSPENHLEPLILHELFHILSRNNPDLRKNLYAIVGFHPINHIEYPEELRSRRITNPDSVDSGWVINLTNRNRVLPAVPILYSSKAHYEPEKGGEFFAYLTFKMLVVEKKADAWTPRLSTGRPQLFDPGEVEGFFEQVGRNTDYIIHPEEILAVNFVHMVTGETNLATPRIPAEMKSMFKPPRMRITDQHSEK